MSKKSILIKISIVVISVVVAIFTTLLILFYMLFPPKISWDTMEKKFLKQQDTLTEIAEYFATLEYNSIHITSTDKTGEMYVTADYMEMHEHIPISDIIIAKKISTLLHTGYLAIDKHNNGVYFAKWDNMDCCRGVVYSVDGEKPQNEHLILLEPLDEENWYFYEEN